MVQARSQKVKNKLCWNCEGSAPVAEKNCPYCGVYLGAPTEDADLSPPYKMENGTKEKTAEIPKPIYQPEQAEEPAEIIKTDVEVSSDHSGEVVCTVFLSLGVILFLFSLVLLIFSTNGLLTLQWNASYWYLYMLLSLPLLGLAWRSLQQVPEE